MKKILLFIFILILSACASPQVTEETDCCLAMDFTLPAPTEIQTPVPTPNQTQTAQVDERLVFQTLVAEYPSICNAHYSHSFSPDGLWMSEFCETGIENRQVLIVSNRETKTLWKMFYLDYVPNSDDGMMSIQHWSNDGKYAYFSSYPTGSGGVCFTRYGYQEAWRLFRLNLQTGHINEILPVVVYDYYGFSFSPIDSYLVYGLSSGSLTILDIATGESINVTSEKDFSFRGGYIWSQDGLTFIYSTVIYSSDYSKQDSTIRLVDAKTGMEQVILESSQDCLHVVEWVDTNIIKIQTNYYESLIEFDLNTNTILSETPINP